MMATNQTQAASYLLSVHGDPWAVDVNRMRALLKTLIVSDMPQTDIEARTHPRHVAFYDCEAAPLAIGSDAAVAANPLEAALSNRKTRKAIAVLPMLGPMTQRPGLFTAFFGGTSTEKWGRVFDDLVANPNVGAIVVDADTPGGTVAGVPELADKIFQARGGKPVVFVANTWIASAGYWLATQGDEIVASPSGEVGSIGVWSMHVDYSAQLKQDGVEVTLISAGEYKVEGNPYQPLSDDAKAYMTEEVVRYYDLFVGAVARGRNVAAAQVRKGFGQGRMVGPKKAKDAGMIDRIATLEQTIRRLGGNIARREQGLADKAAREAELAALEREFGDGDTEATAAVGNGRQIGPT